MLLLTSLLRCTFLMVFSCSCFALTLLTNHIIRLYFDGSFLSISEFRFKFSSDYPLFIFLIFRGTALTMKKMLETSFPVIEVVLENYPPPLPKRLLSKLVPVVQFGVIGVVLAGDQIFPRLGFMAPPPWYFNLRANRFGSIATTWLLGNFLQSFLQSSGAFEVYCNGNMVSYFCHFSCHIWIYIYIYGSNNSSNYGIPIFFLSLWLFLPVMLIMLD